MATIANTAALTDLFVMGSKLKSNVKEAVTSAKISLTTEEVSQIEFTMIDPDYKILKTGLFSPKTPVRFRSQNFIIASTDTGMVAGNEQVTIKCRPAIVQKLKERRGAKSMSNVSPSDFVASECKAVGAKYVIQPSSKQAQVSRDVPEKGKTYDLESTPSTWTTFQRLAREVGFILFEVNGVIYFGKPTWIMGRSSKNPMVVTWNTGYSYFQAEQPPECSKSIDSKEVTVSVTVPLQRTKDAATGKAFKLTGVPTFNGTYMTKSIEYSLMSSTERMTITAGTPIDPVAQPPATAPDSYTYESISQHVTTGGSYTGVWPLPTKYKVTTPFGKRGSWAAGYHTGADFSAPRGTPVYAVYDGKISIGGWGSAYGKHVILTVGKKKYGYCHLSTINVYAGKKVKAGDKLGEVGNTGRSFGNHLHLELRYAPFKYGNKDEDPIPTLKKKVSGTSGVATTYSGAGLTIEGKPWDGSLKGLLQAVGFSGKALNTAMGVVWAESNNNAQAVGDTSLVNSTWGPSIGLFQIRSLKNPSSATGLDRYRQENRLYDPVYNAALAYQMSKKGTSWGPWSAYNNGSYKKFVGKNGKVKGLGVSSGTNPSSSGAKFDNGATKSANSLVIRALSQTGKRYVFGATRYPSSNDPSSFDCSSLVNWCFLRMGIKIPDLVLPKIAWCKKNGGYKMSPSEGYRVRGALMMRTNTTPRHIGISLGDGRTIEAVSSKLGVRKMDTRYNWTEAWAAPKLKYGSDLAKVIADRGRSKSGRGSF